MASRGKTTLPDSLLKRQGSPPSAPPHTWVEGRVAAGLGKHDQARQLLTDIRQKFLADGNAFDAALATLDLVISNLEQGKTAKVRDLADEMVIVFRDLGVSREALAALLLFQEAARRETATADLVREIAATLTRTPAPRPAKHPIS